MASFQAKIDLGSERKRENRNCRSVPTRRVIENFKQRAKKLKNTITTSFQSKIHLKRPRKRENENYCFDPFLLDP